VKINALKLVTPLRFDVTIKYLYAQSIVKGYNCNFFLEAYKRHLWIWNKFKEYDNPNKKCFEDFNSTFIDIINSFKNSGFNPNISKIPTLQNKYILNGSHRLAAALACDVDVEIKNSISKADGQFDCSYKFFQKLNLENKYFDIASLEYTKLKNNSFLIFIFPSAIGHRNELEDIILRNSNIFYKKEIQLNKNGSLNLIKCLYQGEMWGGNYSNGFVGFKEKQSFCFTNNTPLKVYLVDFESLKAAVETKEKIRSLYKIGKHSVHINDTHEQTRRLAKIVFNKNSLHHLNNQKSSNFKIFNKWINNFKTFLCDENLDIDEYCITASSTLSAYGLREAKDIDYLHHNLKTISIAQNPINTHNEYGEGRYHLSRNDIIFNPENHFYYNGLKFASLEVVKKLKEKRGESKDYKDIELINSLK
jgi:hypothetical protein